ncbi:Bromodomain-containing protein [Sporormia fimetaria CBS 119925]|uniref:Bromodomain-containing protein n=1 Tax=Sporormia fimetaria CBS 119925 TaxID=1340428 RepID=A0A6A6VKY2_9PLEO|nr:Bromodomain-containing protein [Sporormia fimetaria CBS 119925]
MESAAKRKAAGAAQADNEGRPAKRQKVPDEPPATPTAKDNEETHETTTNRGLKFLESLRAAKDKTGRPIATHFLELPDKNELPDYYDVIKLPISIQTMEDKLKAHGYATLGQLESDCKRLVNNAKMYNDKKSLVYEDAERLRKTASNWMTKHNPAYRIRGYQAMPTPIPGEDGTTPARPPPRVAAPTPRPPPATPTPDLTERPRRTAAPVPNTPAPSKLRHSVSAPKVEKTDSTSFDGKTFQEAQEQIITGLIDYVEPESELHIFLPFVNLPSRSLKDYYQLIKHPVSLSGVQRKVRGVIGRNQPTGFTLFKSWNAFEEEMSWIWRNAREYNEDGSDLYNLSVELEEMFKEQLAAAKAKVEEPPQPKLKINMSTAAPLPQPKQQLKLRLRQSPSSEAHTPRARSSATPGVIVDNDALLRQQRHVHDGLNGSSEKPQTPQASGRTPSVSIAPQPSRLGAASPAAANGIKNDVPSPALSSVRPATMVSDGRTSVSGQTPHPMAPPQTVSRPASGSPHPNGVLAPQPAAYNPYHTPPNHYVPPTNPQAGVFRPSPLKNLNDALIPKVTITTAPTLNLPKPFTMTIPAHKQKMVQSITINLPPSHSHLQITPYLPVALDGRPWRSFYTLNGKLYSESLRTYPSQGVNGVAPGYEQGRKKGEPLYDAKLQPGVNRVEVEVIAEKKGKHESKDPKEAVEIERCVIFVNLMRA